MQDSDNLAEIDLIVAVRRLSLMPNFYKALYRDDRFVSIMTCSTLSEASKIRCLWCIVTTLKKSPDHYKNCNNRVHSISYLTDGFKYLFVILCTTVCTVFK